MLAIATGDCAVTNVTYNENKYYVVTRTFHLESSMHWRRRQIVVKCHIAYWLRSGAVLKFDQFCHSSFFWTRGGQFILLGGHFEKAALTEGRTFLWK